MSVAIKCVTKFGCLLTPPWDKCHHLSPGDGEGAGRGEGKNVVEGIGKGEKQGMYKVVINQKETGKEHKKD